MATLRGSEVLSRGSLQSTWCIGGQTVVGTGDLYHYRSSD